jgi:predicted AlkP superfamily pyrophosphatase or phosphodiesterase
MSKTILVVLDGCSFEGATDNLGYLEHLIESGFGCKYKVMAELPSSSRPLYETIFTGLPVNQHGIVSNKEVRKSCNINVFQLCQEETMVTAASAYYWISELYVKAPFDILNDRIQLENGKLNSARNIDYGIYYYEDFYPDSHVFNDGEFLRRTYEPDFLLIHSMNIDDAGHKSNSEFIEYNKNIANVNVILSDLLPKWIQEGYKVVITSDHGMNENGLHGGNTLSQRLVPLYIFSDDIRKGSFCGDAISQLAVAPLLCKLLEIKPSLGMKKFRELGDNFFEKQ